MWEVRFPLQVSLFYLAFIEHERVITAGQHVFDTRSEGCPHTDDSDEITHPVVREALRRGGFDPFSSTVYEDLISILA